MLAESVLRRGCRAGGEFGFCCGEKTGKPAKEEVEALKSRICVSWQKSKVAGLSLGV